MQCHLEAARDRLSDAVRGDECALLPPSAGIQKFNVL
jgi:hypothetical protein